MGKRVFQVLVIPYCRMKDSVQYAVFQRADDLSWQWIAGGGNIGELPIDAAKRESWEEAGIPEDLPYTQLQTKAFIPAECFSDLADTDAKNLVEYSFGVQVDPNAFELSNEHTQCCWLGFSEAMQRLKWNSNKDALRELHANLMSNSRRSLGMRRRYNRYQRHFRLP